jgi:hypothetical protein
LYKEKSSEKEGFPVKHFFLDTEISKAMLRVMVSYYDHPNRENILKLAVMNIEADFFGGY